MLIVTSTSQATRHGVYGIEREPPATIRAQGVAVTGICEQFPWGPADTVTEVTDMRSFIDTFAPPGMSHTGAGYMAVMGKAWPSLKVVRAVAASGTVAASCTINKTGPTALFVLTLKYVGTAGNSVTATTSAATDGDANHFNLAVTVTGASGTTTDKFENINLSGVGSDSFPTDFTNTKLLGAFSKSSAGVPLMGTTSFTSGADGSIAAADYVGTQGLANKGIALFEGDRTIDSVITGDPGNSFRATVNAGLMAHADYMTDRVAFISGNSGLTLAGAQTDVASYRSLRCVYADCWAYVKDDVDGTERLVSPAVFAASLAANLSPSTSFSWKSSVAKKFLAKISRLETNRGDGAYSNELAGICTLQAEPLGGYSFEAAVVTAAPTTPAKRKYKRTRMTHYIAKAIVSSLREYTDSPNVPVNQQDEVSAVSDFLETLKGNAKTNPNALPHIVDFAIRPLADFNSQVSIDGGEFTIPCDIKLSSDQERIFVSMKIGESVTVESVL